MDKRQMSRMNSYRRLRTLLAENASVFADFDAVHELISGFQSLVTEMDTDLSQQEMGSVGVTDAKKRHFETLERICLKLSNKAWVWAKLNANDELAHLFDISNKDFDVADARCISLARSIYAELLANLTSLEDYRITSANTNALLAAINQAEQQKAEAQNQRVKLKLTSERLRELQTAAELQLDMLERLLSAEYGESHAEFVDLFISTRVPETLPTQHSTVRGTVRDAAGQPLRHAECRLSAADVALATESEADGSYVLRKFVAGEYTLRVTLDGYQPFVRVVDVGLGDTVELDVTLTAEA